MNQDTAGFGLAIGAALCFVFGLMVNQIGLGIAPGAAFRLIFGFTIPEKEKKKAP